MFREIVDIYCENHTRGARTLCDEKMQRFVMLNQVVHIVTTVIWKFNKLVLIEQEGPASAIRNSATGK